ncbi:ABC transporter ATP-binding protein [Nocardia sp. SC052]|uniref:ABC transporter ATP-binding protein n=1 Tax=Nocardia sichangensis TaxID=3385975 RepID=UPI0039A199C8
MSELRREDRVRYRDLVALLRRHAREVGAGAVLLLAGTGAGLVQPWVTMRIIDAVAGRHAIAGLVALLIVVFVAQALFETCGDFLVSRTSERVVFDLRARVVERLLRVRMPALDRMRIGDLTSRLGADTSAMREHAVTSVVQLGISVVSAITALAAMVWLSPFMTVVTLVTIATAGLLVAVALAGIRTASESAQTGVGELAADTERALSSLRTVRANSAEDREAARLTAKAAEALHSGVRAARMEAIIRPASSAAVNGSFLALLLIGGIRVAGDRMEVGELVGFLLYATFLATPLAGAISLLGSIQKGMGAFQRVAEALRVAVEDDTGTEDPAPLTGLGKVVHDGRRRPATVELRTLTFSYESSRRALDEVSFTVPGGEQVALVGRSGSGKSTVLSLIERFYEPDGGVILLDGHDVSRLHLPPYRRRIAFVEQGAPILHGSVRENLTYAHPHATQRQVERAVELAGFEDVLARLDGGMDAQVGEHGQSLSGGERQRLAIARALLTEPDLLLLDEPTSNLDPISEAAVLRTLRELRGRCTVLVAAHRYSTIRDVDSVVVLDGGRVEAIGTHDELMASSEYYRELAKDTITASA